MSSAGKIGAMIRFHRKKAKLSQVELALLAGVGKTAVFDAEKGKETIKLATLFKLLYALNISFAFNGPLVAIFERQYNEKG